MSNVLNEEKKQQVLALGRLGWPLRKIQQATRIPVEDWGKLLGDGSSQRHARSLAASRPRAQVRSSKLEN